MTEESIFARETRVIEQAEAVAQKEEFAQNPLLQPYLDLLAEYRKLFRQTQRMVKMSDRMQQSLNELNAELQEHKEILSRMSYVDGLTAVANRRRFDECLEVEWKRNRRDKFPLALILLDLDYFKQYNDHYGHRAGDDCLIKVTRAMSNAVKRPGDLVARYGGEEFVVLLPETDCSGARYVASEIQESVQRLGITHEYSQTARVVTVSIGIAVMIPDSSWTPAKLIEEADTQLYAAKKAGRNRIKAKVVSNGSAHPEVLRAT